MVKDLITILLIYVVCASCAQERVPTKLRNVGDIPEDPQIDERDFKVCNPDETFQYYNFSKGLQYKGEKAAIKKKFQSVQSKGNTADHGYITIRFIVNCEGKTGRFRIQQMDMNYQPDKFPDELVQKLLSTTKSLNGWEIGMYEGVARDYYQYLTFKIENGELKEIMP